MLFSKRVDLFSMVMVHIHNAMTILRFQTEKWYMYNNYKEVNSMTGERVIQEI